MSAKDIYELHKQQIEDEALARDLERAIECGIERGMKQQAKRMLFIAYEARFGAMPPELRDVIEASFDLATLERWCILAGTGAAEDLAAAVHEPVQTIGENLT